MVDIGQRFLDYAEAFEDAVTSDNWAAVGQYFSDNAEYIAIDGEQCFGRQKIVEYFQQSVDSIDRKFEKREVMPLTPKVSGNDVLFMIWENKFSISGAPELIVSGTGRASYEGPLIARLHDELDEGVAERLGVWMQEHSSKLPQ